MKKPERVESPDGKLAVFLPGMGAVATTFVAGCILARRGLAPPVGSLTQLGTIRLGRRTEHRNPHVRDFAPLAALEDLEFCAWDIFEDDA
jgi:myo-inositol-1-phosphate synthase